MIYYERILRLIFSKGDTTTWIYYIYASTKKRDVTKPNYHLEIFLESFNDSFLEGTALTKPQMENVITEF